MMPLVKLVIILAALVGGGGTALTVVNPENAIAAPFKGTATVTLEGAASAVKMFKDTRSVAASYERRIVSTGVHSMMIQEGLSQLTAVTVATNDMASFPSRQHPLYPQYVESKATEFKYTIDKQGVVGVDASDVTTDPMLEEILQKLAILKSEESQ